MAVYATTTKTFVIQAPQKDEDSDTAATYSAKINDYIETLDSTNETVISMDVTKLYGNTVLVTILHNEAG